MLSLLLRALTLTLSWTPPSLSETLTVIPTVEFNSTSSTTYALGALEAIVVDSTFQNSTDMEGKTLIPPTLLEFAETFSADLKNILNVSVPVKTATSSGNNSVFLTLSSDPDSFLDVAGRKTSEGYSFEVTKNGVEIAGASPLGVWWGTRTLLQQAVLGKMELPLGAASDAPGWGTRGIMIDAGRHYYPPSFITEMCSYLSFYKMNTFHVHLSDNLDNNVNIYSTERSLDLYAAFRLNSDDPAVEGLVKPFRVNETYSRDVFDDIQSTCASRGVTIIPELEAPGHALVITQWKQDLGLSTDLSLLNISEPDTIPTMETIWKTFLPWFHVKTVHIGADEYDSSLADDYNLFVNTMDEFINSTSGKDIRIWGTNEPGKNSTVNTNVTIQHWEYFEDNPLFDLIKKGYNVLNSDDSFYMVNKFSASYPHDLNLTRIFDGNPAGGAWAPYVFDVNNATNNPSRDEPLVVGHIAALWNDYGPNASTYLEAYYCYRDTLPALADKQWGGSLTEAAYATVFPVLHAATPGQNLDRDIASKTSTILNYTFTGSGTNRSTILDSSGNGYHGACTGCSVDSGKGILELPTGGSHLTTPLSSKGRNYTLSFDINPSSNASIGSPIFSGRDSTLLFGNGTRSEVALVAAGNAFMLNYTLPTDTWTSVDLIGRGNATFLAVDGGEEMEFLTVIGINGESFVWASIAIEAPVETVGSKGFLGSFKSIVLEGKA